MVKGEQWLPQGKGQETAEIPTLLAHTLGLQQATQSSRTYLALR